MPRIAAVSSEAYVLDAVDFAGHISGVICEDCVVIFHKQCVVESCIFDRCIFLQQTDQGLAPFPLSGITIGGVLPSDTGWLLSKIKMLEGQLGETIPKTPYYTHTVDDLPVALWQKR